MRSRTDIVEVVARKLAPFMFLFGFYLVTFGDTSPGGGFQGGVVIASGVILIALSHDATTAERLVSRRAVTALESAGYIAFIAVAAAGALFGAGLLADFIGRASGETILPQARFVWLLNVVIGLKVAAGTSLICLSLFGEER